MAKSATMRWYCQPSPTSLVVPAISLCPLSVVYLYKSTYRHTRVCLASALNNVPWFVGEPVQLLWVRWASKGSPLGRGAGRVLGVPLLFCTVTSNAALWKTLYLQKALVAVALPLPPCLTALFFFPPQHIVCTGRLRWYPDPSVIHCIQSCEVSPPAPSTSCLLLAGELLAMTAPAQSRMALISCLLQVGPGLAG